MASIKSTIKVIEDFTNKFKRINTSIDTTISNFDKLEKAANLPEMGDNLQEIANNLDNINDKQKSFSESMKQTSSIADQLTSKIQTMVNTYLGLFTTRKIMNFLEDSLSAYTIQTNAEVQLAVVLRNVKADPRAFDELVAKAAEVQSRGIFGDEPMIAAAAEFATYFTDAEAIKTMMDTLANYAIGMNGGKAVSVEQMINYATNLGKIANETYDAMIKKGFVFSDAQKAIISGTATQADYLEVLGEEYINMTEDMRKAQAISQVINSLWGGLYEKLSNTPVGLIIQFQNAWGDMTEVIGARLSPSIIELFSILIANLPVVESFLLEFANLLNPMISLLNVVLNVFFDIGRAVMDFFTNVFPNLSTMTGLIIGVTITVLSLGAAFTLLTSPISLVIMAITGIISAIYLVIEWIGKLTKKSISATGVISASFLIMYSVIMDSIGYVWNYAANFIEWFINCWRHPIASTKVFFANFLSYALDVAAAFTKGWDNTATNIANAMISAINFVIRGWNKLIDLIGEDIANKLGLKKGSIYEKSASISNDLSNVAESIRLRAEELKPSDYVSLNRMQILGLNEAYRRGYEFGSGLESYSSDNLESVKDQLITGMPNIENYAKNQCENTAAVSDKLSYIGEDLSYLRDLAEQETINKFTTAEINFEMTNNNQINSEMDLDGIVNSLTQKLNEQLSEQVIGVYNN